MYNRYIPQADGSYRRSRIQDSPPRQNIPKPEPQTQPQPPCQTRESAPCPAQSNISRPVPSRPVNRRNSCGSSVGSFLKQLLPGNFDTADLFVILLLLLMSGDCPEDQNTALLTLALYLFL